MNPQTIQEKVLENRLRRQAKRLGLLLVKSRAKLINVDNYGGYMILDPYRNTIVAAEKFDLDLDGVKVWLDEYEQDMIKAKGAK